MCLSFIFLLIKKNTFEVGLNKIKIFTKLPTLQCGIQRVEVQNTNHMEITHNTPVIF
jgi:hypothetical protein